MVDYPDPDSRVPREITEHLRSQGLFGKPIGISRVTFSETPIPDDIWKGVLPEPTEFGNTQIENGPTVHVERVHLGWMDIIRRLTFGAYGCILDLRLPVEPDFVIRRPGNRYTLVEIERPSKRMATKRGQARAEVTQASFQIAEFKDYILEHYEALKDRFPGINRNPSTMVIISRSTEASFGGRHEVRRQVQLMREQIGADELLTYDDLLARADMALVRLSGLSPQGADR